MTGDELLDPVFDATDRIMKWVYARTTIRVKEVAESIIRAVGMATHIAELRYHRHNIPQWGRGTQNEVQVLRQEVDQLRAQFRNVDAARFNRRCFGMSSQHRIPLRRFAKVLPGQGQAIPGSQPTPAEQAELQLLTPLQVGDLVSAQLFPLDVETLGVWNEHQMNTLSVLLNNTFDINAGESAVEELQSI